MKILCVNEAAHLLRLGHLIGIPTETVYGLAGNATDPRSVKKIYQVKNRPQDNPLICHVDSLKTIEDFGAKISHRTKSIVNHFSPGPISYLVPLDKNSPLLHATCGLPYVAFRIPQHTKTLELLKILQLPIAAPSANTSGKFSATSAQMVLDDLGEKIAGVIDGGPCQIGLESTILDCREDNFSILRPGKIGTQELLAFFAQKDYIPQQHNHPKLITPGSKYKHYSPKTPLLRINSLPELPYEDDTILMISEEKQILFKNRLPPLTHIINLGRETHPDFLAQQLYFFLFQLDQKKATRAFFLYEFHEESSITQALQERLEKIFHN